jgi:F-type H+-transporting ATPase subunit delta
MADYMIAGRYAKALASVIENDEGLEEARDALQAVSQLFATHHDLHSCLANPSIQVEQREQVLDALLEKLGFSGPVKSLIHHLLERGRMDLLDEIACSFTGIVDERMGRVAAHITTALELSSEDKEFLSAQLGSWTDKEVRMHCEVDPEIIGGVIAYLQGTVIDGSLRTRLAQLKETLLAAPL